MPKDGSYRRFVRSLAESKENRTFLNSDEDHALDVLVQIFNSAQSVVRIFAGCLCEPVGNKPEYIIALSEFIERGGEVFIMLNDYKEDDARRSNLFKRLAYYQSQGKPVHVKATETHPYRVQPDGTKKDAHLTVADDCAYRIETDIELRTAECNMNNPVLAKKLIEFYDGMYSKETSEELDLNLLFGNGD